MIGIFLLGFMLGQVPNESDRATREAKVQAEKTSKLYYDLYGACEQKYKVVQGDWE